MKRSSRTSQSSLHILKEYKILEINRSVCLYLAIIKFLTALAALMLFFTNTNMLTEWLETTQDVIDRLYTIPHCIINSLVGDLMPTCFSTIFGIYGFAVLNQHVIFFYNSNLILQIIKRSTNYIQESDVNHIITTDFVFYGKSNRSRKLVDSVQQIEQCCGSFFYTFQDLETLPSSCCQDFGENGTCAKGKIFKEICDVVPKTHNSHNVYNDWNRIVLCCLLYYVVEIVLATHILYILIKYDNWKSHNVRVRNLI